MPDKSVTKVTRLIYDRRFTYPVPHGEVTTRVRVFRLKTGLDVLIATELDDEENPGPSITNTIENLATAAVEAFGLDPERLTVYQHYDYRAAAYQPNGEAETFDEVTFEWQEETGSRPQWRRRTRASLVVLLALADFDSITTS